MRRAIGFGSFLLFVVGLWCCSGSSTEPISLTEFKLQQVPDSLSGCSCLYAETEAKYKDNAFMYFDDIGDHAVISVGGNLRLLKSTGINNEYSDGEFSARIEQERMESKVEEVRTYSAELIVKDRQGHTLRRRAYGVCGC